MTPREAVLELKARISRSIAAASTARSLAVSRRGAVTLPVGSSGTPAATRRSTTGKLG